MKTTRVLVVSFLVLVGFANAWAQTSVTFVGVNKIENYQQTTSTVNVTPTSWDFDVFLDGNGHSASYPATNIRVIPPGGTAGNQEMTYNVTDQRWVLSTPQTFGSSGALATAFTDGTYTMNFGSTLGASDVASISVNLATAAFPNAAEASVTNGTWGGGLFTVTNPTQALVITTNNFAGLVDGDKFHIGISVDGNSYSGGNELFNTNYNSVTPDPTFLAFTVGGNVLTAGTYTVRLEFNRLVDYGTSNTFGAEAIAAFSSVTTFQIQVIPEPAAYAAVFGVMALTGVMIHRRRRTV